MTIYWRRRLLNERESATNTSFDEETGTTPGPSIEPSRTFDCPHPAQWPRLEHLQLSAGGLAHRRCSIGGSDANIILSGNFDRVRQLWLEKRGEAEPADLSTNLSVMLG